MKVLLDIQDNKVPFVMELLINFKFVKIKQVNSYKEDVLDGISEAVTELNQIKAGEKELKGWSRKKKGKLITMHNPEWNFLFEEEWH